VNVSTDDPFTIRLAYEIGSINFLVIFRRASCVKWFCLEYCGFFIAIYNRHTNTIALVYLSTWVGLETVSRPTQGLVSDNLANVSVSGLNVSVSALRVSCTSHNFCYNYQATTNNTAKNRTNA
jgi:hypothetical protein